MEEPNQRQRTNVEVWIDYNKLLLQLVLDDKEDTEVYKVVLAELQISWKNMLIEERNDIRNYYKRITL